uniref:Uncharacterized protein n=1 Tax=Lepeophtheirus salmonis TaxID=72036 RepID=A0A0K2U3V4_LEPSM
MCIANMWIHINILKKNESSFCWSIDFLWLTIHLLMLRSHYLFHRIWFTKIRANLRMIYHQYLLIFTNNNTE